MSQSALVTKADFINKALELITGDREATHGDAYEQLNQTAYLWSDYLGYDVTGIQVTMCIALMKISRSCHGQFNPDDYIDLIGYAAIAGELEAMAKAAPEKQKEIEDALSFAMAASQAQLKECEKKIKSRQKEVQDDIKRTNEKRHNGGIRGIHDDNSVSVNAHKIWSSNVYDERTRRTASKTWESQWLKYVPSKTPGLGDINNPEFVFNATKSDQSLRVKHRKTGLTGNLFQFNKNHATSAVWQQFSSQEPIHKAWFDMGAPYEAISEIDGYPGIQLPVLPVSTLEGFLNVPHFTKCRLYTPFPKQLMIRMGSMWLAGVEPNDSEHFFEWLASNFEIA